MSKQSFLCGNCKSVMCDDCRNIAEEYQELLDNRTRALQIANNKAERLEREIKDIKRRSDMYEEISKAGLGEIISAWMDKEITQLLKVKP